MKFLDVLKFLRFIAIFFAVTGSFNSRTWKIFREANETLAKQAERLLQRSFYGFSKSCRKKI